MSEVLNYDFTISSPTGTCFLKRNLNGHIISYKEIHFIAHSGQIYLFTYYQTSVLTLGGFKHTCKPTTLARKKKN